MDSASSGCSTYGRVEIRRASAATGRKIYGDYLGSL